MDRPERPQGRDAEASAPAVRLPVLGMSDVDERPWHDAGAAWASRLLADGSPMVKTGHACNLDCTYCCNRASGAALMPVDELCRTVDGLAALGYRGVGYMGGEPTIHPGFPTVVRHAAALGFTRQLLATNGVRLADSDLATALFTAGINAVTLSLDSFDPSVQEPLYGGRSLHRDALAGVHHVLSAPAVELLVSAVVTAPIAGHLPSYIDEVALLQQRYQRPVGVMLCLLQQPFRSGSAQQALPLPLLESAERTLAALERARERGVPAVTFGYPPCVLPGHEHNVSELYATEWVVEVATGVIERSRLGDPGRYWAACTTCPHAAYCVGVMRQYATPDVRAHVEQARP